MSDKMDSKPKAKIKKAAAVSYDMGEPAPKIIAKGKGIVADKIIEKADALNLPIYEDPKLAELLTGLEIGEYIPEELYQIVAEVMVFVTNLDKLQDKINVR